MVNLPFSRLIVSLAVACATGPAVARAATVTVNTTAPDNPNDGLCGIAEAVTAVNQRATFRNCTYTPNGQNDRIIVPNGTHTLNSELFLAHQASIEGASQANTIISSGGVAIVSFVGDDLPNATLTLKNLTLQKNSQTLPVQGVVVTPSEFHANLVMDNVRVTNCNSRGVFLSGDVSATITNSTIDNNSVGIETEEATLQITSSTIRNNRLAGIDLTRSVGGVLFASITNSTIRDNVSNGPGAGLKVTLTRSTNDDSPIVDIVGTTFSGNQANGTSGNGGGIHTNASIEIRESVFDNNRAAAGGGGLFITEGSVGTPRVVVSETAFRNNRAVKGAGIHLAGSGPTVKLNIFESTIGPGNVATGDGGGIFTSGQIDEAANLTIHGNRAVRGGGLFHDNNGELHLRHLTVMSNVATQSGGGAGFRLSGGNHIIFGIIFANNMIGTAKSNVTTPDAFLRAGYCLIDDRSSAQDMFPIAPGGTNIVGPPGVGALTTPSGSRTEVFPLQTGSLAIDAIPESGASTTIVVDQRGATRPVDGDFDANTREWDIGAVEARQTTASLFQAESMTVAAQSAHTLVIENNAGYSNGQGRVLQASTLTNPAPFVTLQSTTIQPGTYGVTARFKRANNAARIQLAVGTSAGSTSNLGAPVDTFRSSVDWTAAYLGTITVTASGARFLRFSAPSKNSSSSAFFMYLDSVRLFTNGL